MKPPESPLTIDSHGWLSGVRRVPSPNFNDRPKLAEISLLVLHNISLPPEQFGGPYICDFFTNCLDINADPYFEEIAALQVSSHVLIDRQGEIIQFVSFDHRAWHAGKSCFDGVDNCNDYSAGIELEGADDIAYTDSQYQTLVQISRALMAYYPTITKSRIAGHCDIAAGRKTDPGSAFDWQRYFSALG